jgi:hypothetical protein
MKSKTGIPLSEFALIKTNFPDADFWVTRKGSQKSVGTPTDEFNKEHIGVKVTATDVIDPKYLKYVVELHQQLGYFAVHCYGTLELKNIRVQTVKNIRL